MYVQSKLFWVTLRTSNVFFADPYKQMNVFDKVRHGIMCKTVLYSFTVILGSDRNIEMLNDACMLFPVAISKKCRKSLRYSIGFSCFSDAPVAVVLSRSVARSKSVIGRRSS